MPQVHRYYVVRVVCPDTESGVEYRIIIFLSLSSNENTISHRVKKHTISTFVDQTHIQRTRPHRKKQVFFRKTSLPMKRQSGLSNELHKVNGK